MMVTNTAAIVLFARLPVPGKAKTRLAATVGPTAAAAFYKLCAQLIFHEAFRCAAADAIVFCSTPDDVQGMQQWLADNSTPIPVQAQLQSADLGQRMLAALTATATGTDSATATGTDPATATATGTDSATATGTDSATATGTDSATAVAPAGPCGDSSRSSTVAQCAAAGIQQADVASACAAATADHAAKYCRQHLAVRQQQQQCEHEHVCQSSLQDRCHQGHKQQQHQNQQQQDYEQQQQQQHTQAAHKSNGSSTTTGGPIIELAAVAAPTQAAAAAPAPAAVAPPQQQPQSHPQQTLQQQHKYESVLVIGTDIPDLSSGIIDAAVAALTTHDMVLGPAKDGGFYLMGFRTDALLKPEVQAGRVFKSVVWSTDSVLQRTVAGALQLGLQLAPLDTLPVLQDIDTVRDLRAWCEEQHVCQQDEEGVVMQQGVAMQQQQLRLQQQQQQQQVVCESGTSSKHREALLGFVQSLLGGNACCECK